MYCPGVGNLNSKIVFVGDCPGLSETTARQSLIAGASGDVLDKVFSEIGHPDFRNEFYFTNVYKQTPPRNNIKYIDKVCIPEREIEKFWKEVQEINPNVIVPLGETALNVVTGLKKILLYRGSILPSIKFGYLPKVVPTIHPLHLTRPRNDSGDYFEDKKIYNGIWRNIMQLDIVKALEESRIRDYHPPERNLRVASSSLDVIRLIGQNKKADRAYIDVETSYSTLCSCIALSFNDYESLSIPLFQKVGNIKLCSIPHSDLTRIWQELQKLFSQIPIAGQNLKFDQAKLELLGFSFPMGVKSDVMLKAHTVNPELPSKGLAFLTSIYTKEPYYKDEGKEFNPSKHDIKRLFLYNAKDTAITAEIDKELEKELHELSEEFKTDLVSFYYDFVVHQHQLYFDLEKVGFDIDEGKLKYLQVKYETWRNILQVRLDTAARREININSPKQVNEFIYDDLRLPKPQYGKVRSDEDAIARLLKTIKNEFKRGVLNDILEFRRVSKTLSTYLYCRRDYDGKMRSQYRIIGTETGRSSTSILDEPVRPEPIGFAFQTLTKHGDIGQDIRSYLIPRPDRIFVNVDLSQAEARVVALLSEDYELLAAFDKIDIHRRTAGLVLYTGRMNLSYDFDETCDTIEKDSPERFMGKKVRHAGNYNMGWREFMSNVISDCRRFNIEFTISKFKAEQILTRFHAANPKLKSNFHAQIIDAIDSKRALVTPFGRVRRFFDRYSNRLHGEAYAYIPQETVKGRLTRAALKIRAQYPELRKVFCGEAHDSLTMQLPISEHVDICRAIKPIIEEPIDFSGCTLKRGQLIIPCDFEVGKNYKDFAKLKV